jgi:hypothetical protein
MTEPKTVVRSATYFDIIDVIAAMRKTERGCYDLNCFALVAGAPSASQLRECSVGMVALVKREDPHALAVAGFIPQLPGVLRTWMLATDAAWLEHGAELTWYTYVGIGVQIEQGGARRIETVCPDSHTAAKAWYPRLGLKQESTLAKYCTDGSDAALFVRLRGEA